MYRTGNDFDKLVNFIYESCMRRPLYFSNNSFVDKGLRQIYRSFLFFIYITHCPHIFLIRDHKLRREEAKS